MHLQEAKEGGIVKRLPKPKGAHTALVCVAAELKATLNLADNLARATIGQGKALDDVVLHEFKMAERGALTVRLARAFRERRAKIVQLQRKANRRLNARRTA